MANFLAANAVKGRTAKTAARPKRKCPTCGQPAVISSENKARPFCTPRCKDVDLGRWFNEYYTVPVVEEHESSDAFYE